MSERWRTGRRLNEWNEMNRPEMNEGRKEWMSEMSGRGMSKWRGERMNELPCFEHLALKMLNLVSVVFFFLMFVSLFILYFATYFPILALPTCLCVSGAPRSYTLRPVQQLVPNKDNNYNTFAVKTLTFRVPCCAPCTDCTVLCLTLPPKPSGVSNIFNQNKICFLQSTYNAPVW